MAGEIHMWDESVALPDVDLDTSWLSEHNRSWFNHSTNLIRDTVAAEESLFIHLTFFQFREGTESSEDPHPARSRYRHAQSDQRRRPPPVSHRSIATMNKRREGHRDVIEMSKFVLS